MTEIINVNFCKKATILSIHEKLESATQQRKDLEESTEYKSTTNRLLKLLGDCLDIFLNYYVPGSPETQKEIKKDWTSKLKSIGINVQKNTPPTTMIIKIVFENDRKLASKYSKVIKIASEEGQTGNLLPAWVKEKGGIEEVSREKKDNPERLEIIDLAKLEKNKFLSDENSSIATANFTPQIGISHKGLLLVSPGPGGKTNVVRYLQNISESLLERIFIEIENHNKKNNSPHENDDYDTKKNNKEKEDAIQKAANSISSTHETNANT